MNNNPQVVSRIEGSGADPLTIPFSVGPGKMLVLPKHLWDSLEITPDEPITEHRFFTDVVGNPGTTKIKTNNEGAGRVPRGRIWVFTHLGVALHFPKKETADITQWNEFLYNLRYKTLLEIEIDKRTYFETPLWTVFANSFPTMAANYDGYQAEIFAPMVQTLRLPVKLYLREEVLWNVKLINPSDEGLVLPSNAGISPVVLQVMFRGREYISVERP